ncbi:hypothetical protein AOQ73_21715 [Bradyrhizobium pachyrhizi]|uniref:hypothetical protein n=1 Tax=Bradyrhizobium pachyrhizi TaxID=280333 RepID=UPI000704E0C3|nr:hypothetical protein [Bradyrhizobium pachyrhizi]KRP97062.1 hypothetical protein AOQ73_21715 [Bradyrhizobium pachyrhizi]
MWKDPIKSTPSIIQTDFGPFGQSLPGDGEAYCGPTSMVMGLYWLSANGFTQVAPVVYNGEDDPVAINLERVVAGLMRTSSESGSFVDGMTSGMADYLSACGIGPDLYNLASTSNPDLAWLADQLAPNVSESPQTIVLANFAVGWYSVSQTTKEYMENDGGHVLAPLTVNLTGDTITINNAFPASFENVPNLPSSNPQTVQIAQMPSGWTLENLPLPSEDYSQVVTDALTGWGVYAVLWQGQAWAISQSALPSTSGYEPSTWTINQPKVINTNGGTLTVVAPISGLGGLHKYGEGTLLLTNTNQLIGHNTVGAGTLASTRTSGTPFGSFRVTVTNGGILELRSDGATVDVQIASGSLATFVIGSTGGALQLSGSGNYRVVIGGNDDGTLTNIVRNSGGTLVIVPGGGMAQLGLTQQVFVAGTGANLPIIMNGIVAPYILGEDDDAASSGKFLTYSPSGGFASAATVSSTDVSINDVPADAVYEVVDSQAVESGGVPQVAALEVNGGAITGGDASILVGSQASGDAAGLIMNGGSIATASLSFGAAEGLIYTNATGGPDDLRSRHADPERRQQPHAFRSDQGQWGYADCRRYRWISNGCRRGAGILRGDAGGRRHGDRRDCCRRVGHTVHERWDGLGPGHHCSDRHRFACSRRHATRERNNQRDHLDQRHHPVRPAGWPDHVHRRDHYDRRRELLLAAAEARGRC